MTLSPNADETHADGRPGEPSKNAFRVSFVCSGNICRSPMAEVVLRDLAVRAGLADRLRVTSAGTGDWHVGEQADPRARAALAAVGYDGEAHRARQFDAAAFDDLDLVVALDRTHLRILTGWAPNRDEAAKVRLLLEFLPGASSLDVPDPYYSDDAMFAGVLATIERACLALFAQLEPALRGVPATVPTTETEQGPR